MFSFFLNWFQNFLSKKKKAAIRLGTGFYIFENNNIFALIKRFDEVKKKTSQPRKKLSSSEPNI